MNEIGECNHCWHLRERPIHMVIKDGHMIQTCCKCQAIQQVHRDHIKTA